MTNQPEPKGAMDSMLSLKRSFDLIDESHRSKLEPVIKTSSVFDILDLNHLNPTKNQRIQ